MALIRVAQYSSTPTVVGDYQAQNAHLQAFTNQLMTQQFILSEGTAQPVIKQGCYVSHGGSLYIADADTAITGSPADGSVYIRVSGTTSLTVEFVTDISGYTWNPVYTALTSGSYTLLPYLIVKASTVWTRYNFNPNNQQFGSLASLAVNGNATVGGALGVTGAISGASLGVTGAIRGASINTGYGAFDVGQNLRTTDSPTFAAITAGTIDTGYGDNEVFKISNQKLTITYDEVNMAAMDVGEIRFVSASIRGDDSDPGILKTPSGGSYIVVGYGGAEAESYIRSYTPGNTPIADVYNDSTKYFNGIIRRV